MVKVNKKKISEQLKIIALNDQQHELLSNGA